MGYLYSQTIEGTVTAPACLDVARMKALLKATLEVRRANPHEELPVYFFNQDVVRNKFSNLVMFI